MRRPAHHWLSTLGLNGNAIFTVSVSIVARSCALRLSPRMHGQFTSILQRAPTLKAQLEKKRRSALYFLPLFTVFVRLAPLLNAHLSTAHVAESPVAI